MDTTNPTPSAVDEMRLLASTGDLSLRAPGDAMVVELGSDGKLKAERDRTRQFLRARLAHAELLHTGAGWAILRSAGPTPQPSLRDQAERQREVVMAGVLGEGAIGMLDLVGFLAQGLQTGELSVTTDDVVRSIFLLRGDVVWVSSTAPAESIGEVLVARGRITRADHAAMTAANPARIGKQALDRGLIGADELWGLVQEQLREIFEKTVAADRGVWAFARASEESFAASQVILPTQGLLLDAMRRLDEMRLYRELIRSSATLLSKISPAPDVRAQIARLPDDERELLQSIYRSLSGPVSVLGLMHSTGRSEFEVTRAVFKLHELRLVTVKEESGAIATSRPTRRLSQPEATHIVTVYSMAIREIFNELGRSDQMRPLAEASRAFLEVPPEPHARVLSHARILDTGSLDERALVAGVMTQELSTQGLLAALNELLFFVLFEASESLGARQRDDLARRVKLIQGMIGAEAHR